MMPDQRWRRWRLCEKAFGYNRRMPLDGAMLFVKDLDVMTAFYRDASTRSRKRLMLLIPVAFTRTGD